MHSGVKAWGPPVGVPSVGGSLVTQKSPPSPSPFSPAKHGFMGAAIGSVGGRSPLCGGGEGPVGCTEAWRSLGGILCSSHCSVHAGRKKGLFLPLSAPLRRLPGQGPLLLMAVGEAAHRVCACQNHLGLVRKNRVPKPSRAL